MTTDEERWARAREQLRRPPSDETRNRLRRRRRIVWWSAAGVVLLAVGGGTAAALIGHHSRSATDPATGSMAALGLVLSTAGLLLSLAGLVLVVRSGAFRRALSSPLYELDRSQRRQLLREVTGRVPADPDHADLARDLAHRLSAPSPGFPLLLAGVALPTLNRLLQHPTPGRIAFESFVLALLAAASGLGVRQRRRARRFLAEHPA